MTSLEVKYNYLFRFYFSLFGFQWTFVQAFCLLVGPSGLEPPTSCLSGTRSNLLSYEPMWLVSDLCHLVGGDDGIRTHDPLLAGQVLSQLSYTPIIGYCFLLFFRIGERFYPFPVLCWHWAIFPCRFQQSIFATAELNFCVRNGNRWTLCVCNTNYLSNPLITENWTTLLSRPFFVLNRLNLHNVTFRHIVRSP